MLLPDINDWLALAFESHVHHPIAKSWFDSLTDQVCAFCRVTQQGFLRLASNPKVIGVHCLTMEEAWEKYDAFQSDPRISYSEEPPAIEADWRIFTQRQSYSTNVWTDAYLAAFAAAADYELVSFDKAVVQYAGVKHTVLT